ncbi:TlpA family protein disulfide reductase [Flagellimonas allohymeniacidonis]|uniref:TlpA family protein disulfide reductase n=1 Tax=Flagellimonas allohymeniacidonis TaxID=2517819 RepID=A0A4V2HSA5_9FLAO|nr:TlpA disulfide reductase family protein [Allomuricauda hymeniacidonis]TAI46990.1 TlpA family protein disulfide reductase [Allomuricauda hymeniacidonis]
MKKLLCLFFIGLLSSNCADYTKKKEISNNFDLSLKIQGELDSINRVSNSLVRTPETSKEIVQNDSLTRRISYFTDNIIALLIESYGKVETDTILKTLGELDNSGFIPRNLYDKMTIEDFSTEIGKKAKKKYLAHLSSIRKKQTSIENVNLISEDFIVYRVLEKDTVSLIKVLSNHKGHTVLDFWTTWCAPCRAFNRNFAKEYQKFNESGILVIGLGVRVHDEIEKEKFLTAVQNDNTPWKQYIDLDNRLYDRFKTKKVPFQVLLDEENKIVKILSYDMETELEELIQSQ